MKTKLFGLTLKGILRITLAFFITLAVTTYEAYLETNYNFSASACSAPPNWITIIHSMIEFFKFLSLFIVVLFLMLPLRKSKGKKKK